MVFVGNLKDYATNISELLALRVSALIARVLPARALTLFGSLMGWLCSSVFRIRFLEVENHLTIAFPEKGFQWKRRIAKESYKHLSREALFFLRCSKVSGQDLGKDVRVEGFDLLQKSVQQGSGVMIVSGHLGNWEIGAAALAAKGITIDVVVQNQRNPFVDMYLKDLRERMGLGVIMESEGPYPILKSLRSGRVVAWLGDQNPAKTSVVVDFFGVSSRTARDSVLLTLRAGSALFFASSIVLCESKRKYRVDLEEISHQEQQNPEELVGQLTEAHTKLLEAAIRRTPDQYLWQHRRWKNRDGWLRKGANFC
ncbi:MAG: hypothetical protein CME30_01590 [Gemmatimonadetes bacterium]|nr:hypothetical protein [Gemmatimonadota bacterium]